MTPFRGTNRITSPFGYRTITINGKKVSEHHNGIDVVCTKYAGEPVSDDAWDFREVTGGTVVEVSTAYNSGRGTLVKVQTAPGVIEIYQHNAVNYVKVGQVVPQGTILARAGATGNVTGVHLHFEVQVNGKAVEPSAWLGLPNAAGTYSGNDTKDVAASDEDKEQQDTAVDPNSWKTIQLVTLAPLTDDEMREPDALADDLGLRMSGRYNQVKIDDNHFAAVATVSSGDAMKFMAIAEKHGWDKQKRYHSRFVG